MLATSVLPEAKDSDLIVGEGRGRHEGEEVVTTSASPSSSGVAQVDEATHSASAVAGADAQEHPPEEPLADSGAGDQVSDLVELTQANALATSSEQLVDQLEAAEAAEARAAAERAADAGWGDADEATIQRTLLAAGYEESAA